MRISDWSSDVCSSDLAELRTYGFIDQVCQRLEPLGDTLAVVVHLRNANPRTRDEADSLGRNCQLAPGDVALLQRERQIDSLDPALRARFRADTERGRDRKSTRLNSSH